MMREHAVKGAQDQQLIVDRHQRDLNALAGQEGWDAKRAKKEAQDQIDKAKDTIKDFQPLIKDLGTQWKTPENPNVGYVVYSPPIDKGNKSNDYTMEWALSIEDQEFLRKRHRPRTGGIAREAQTPTSRTRTNSSIRPAVNGKLRTSAIPLDEMMHPKKFDR